MNGSRTPRVALTDIRGDKDEGSLLDMLKKSLNTAPKSIPTLLLYDEKGLKLFEDITYLKDYYLTNAEIEALTIHADAIAQHIPAGSRLVELGSGNLRKVNILLEALEKAKKDVDYFALDVSLPELERTFAELDVSKYQHVRLGGLHGTYDDGLVWLAAPENRNKPTCILSLGSSMGNFPREEAAKFLASYKAVLAPGDLLIIGLDACSDGDRVFKAYNDSEGVTEQFYRNGLDHANRLLGYQAFKQEQWAVEGRYVPEKHAHHAAYIPREDIQNEDYSVRKGERIPFEHSDKYTEEESDQLWHAAGLIPMTAFPNSKGDYNVHLLSPSVIDFSDKPSVYAKSPVPLANDFKRLWAAWDTVTKGMIPRRELWNKPIKLRNDLIFYLGHIPTFADIHFVKATGEALSEPAFYRSIFERGIDPDVENPEKCHAHSDVPDSWPALRDILAHQQRVRDRIVRSIESGQANENRKLSRGLWLAYEHEAMHLETFLYMLLQSERVLQPTGHDIPDFEALARAAEFERSENQWHDIPAAQIRIGIDDPENDLPPDRFFVWDNERPERTAQVPAFQAQSRPISNGEYAKFLEVTQRESLPASWTNTTRSVPVTNGVNGHVILDDATAQDSGVVSSKFLENKAVRTVFGPVPLKYALDWPVMASYDELSAFAEWANGRIPTFEEARSIYHFVESKKLGAEKVSSTLVPAVNGHLSNEGVEETPPSNGFLDKAASMKASETPDPESVYINLKGCNVAFKQWHSTPVTSDGGRLRGQSDCGGLWEWTSTPLAAYEGFKAMDLYPGYTADFFDGKHNICLGGSWATVPRIAGRKSYVNWYQKKYPFVWGTARLVRDVA